MGGQTSLLNSINESDTFGKIRLDVVYGDKTSQYRFLVHAALTFRLHLDTLSGLLGKDENELFENMNQACPSSTRALQFLFISDIKDQELAKSRFIDYHRELLRAISDKNAQEKRRLINQITDFKVAEFKKNWQPGDKISEEDLRAILNYQLKYALTTNNIVNIFNINRSNYQKRVQQLIAQDPELKQTYEYLADVNSSYRNGRMGRYE